MSGGNDSRTNTSLTIADVNPSGNTSISNFSYYHPQMSAELVDKLNEYSRIYEQNEPLYSSALLVLENLYVELETLNHNVPEDHETTDLTKLGLAELEEREKKYWGVMSVNLNTESSAYQEARKQREKVLEEIEVRKSQISEKEQAIENQISVVNSYIVNIQNILGDDLYEELSYFVREQDFQDDSFVATTEMTQEEIFEMQKELMSHAQKELAKVSYPQFEMTIDVINFTAIEDFQKYTDQLELGNIITVEWEPGVLIEARILGMNLDFDNPDKFEILISNKNSLDELWSLLAEIRAQAGSTASTVDYNKGAWNVAKSTSLDFRQFMNSIFDASLQKLQNSDNQEVLIDHTGIILRRWLEEQNKYSPNQVWMTNGQIAFTRDNWNSVCTALGELTLPDNSKVYGIIGDYLIGNVIIGEHLHLIGSASEITLGENPDFLNLSVSVDEFKTQYKDDQEDVWSKITQNEGNIELKVGKDEVINRINISPEDIRIQGRRIILDGNVEFRNTFCVDGNKVGITNINGGNIKTGTITANQIASGTITADEIASGAITSSKIKAGAITASKISSDYVYTGTIDADQINTGGVISGVAIVFNDCSDGGGQCYWTAGADTLGSHGDWFCDSNAMGTGSKNILLWADTGTVQANIGDFSESCHSPDFTNGSDKRMKRDISYEVSGDFETIIDNLAPVSYRMINDENQTLRFGFIAQEVKEQMDKLYGANESPLYRYNSDKDLYSLSYTDIIAPLVAKVQSLQKQINDLQLQINNMQ